MSEQVAHPPLHGGFPRHWIIGFGISFLLLMLFLMAVTWLLARGVGIWGINIPVAWGFAIINFVWWIGIGHAGTFISAILLLCQQDWRTSINRFAEAMTLFAVACAGVFPLLHLGRPWFFYWLLPYPSTTTLWPQFRSPLVWDVFAVSTYGTVSLLFWYLGLLPDLATMRDRAKHLWAKRAYGLAALGWRGASSHWRRQKAAYIILAGLAAPLVISVHSIVGLDFAISQVPGWHSTIFPPYFVAGAIFSGFAMVLTIVIPVRKLYRLHGMITARHLDLMAKVMLLTGLIVAYGYLIEGFMAWYSGETAERTMMLNRLAGAYAPAYWALIACNVVAAQTLWFKAVRTRPVVLFVVSLFINVGMWLERYIIVVTSLYQDYLPSSWGEYHGNFWDWATFLGTIGLFFALLYLFMRFLPMISMSEMRELVHHRPGGKSER
ncbi:MAG: NrfD/PsrC family molybdoenzyme membrane anchor subunit [Sumerlaeia bacterium]